MATIDFDQVSKRFGAAVVADGLTLEIVDGEFFVILGPSGSGKSTLLHMIAGIESPTSGRIRIGGADVTDIPPQRRDIAMVFQSYALYPHLDVAENLAFPLRSRGMSRRAARDEASRVASALGLSALLDKKPRQLSGGQRQRVALGRALIRRPAAFLMDEPLSNLDAALRLEVREEIMRIHQTHRITTVYVTHDQEEALTLGNRVGVLRSGRLEQCDAPAVVYAQPANTFVAHFVGVPPMNLLPASAAVDHPVVRARLGGRDSSDVIVGLRPHAIEVGRTPGAHALELEVTLVELTGADTWIVGCRGDVRLKGRLAAGASFTRGERAYFAFDADALHLFDVGSGLRIG